MLTTNFFIDIIEMMFGLGMFINAFLFLPQAFRIYKEKSAVGVSLSTFAGFLIIQLFIILHGIIHQDYPLILGFSLSMLTCGLVVAFTLFYKSKNNKKLV